ncbi:uncharacterized protein L969DRAFT_386747 [Mixia osmundae IAM 14324]|uniref:Uncharacterized protein n=1 Tax=Mixia osmundae (strain CBS 9802 / IAM 14324 / JCM 22182 / KY 12970) TaxID=764103 RepID=G7E9F8_MIXOS|nr:uncharacterized protein L969DRAFT_386747 [Mixia osmundae IAM 14324]KEI39910.1 hypothetical protein L969DRAFT_386747 [Mixia osmundae IAM 14324]GAA99277.1 hypothetical protein E5Q_05972 [Mixia osmundae IAM 14324]
MRRAAHRAQRGFSAAFPACTCQHRAVSTVSPADVTRLQRQGQVPPKDFTAPSAGSDARMLPDQDIRKSDPLRSLKGSKSPPYLPRPVGVLHPPTTVPITKEQAQERLLSQERRMKERRHLIEEVGKGYFQDMNEIRWHGGKLWLGPPTLIRADKSLYFPNIQGIALSTKGQRHTTDLLTDKVSLLAILSTQVSAEHVQTYVEPVLEQFQAEPRFQVVQINLQENKLKSFLVSMFLSTLRKATPEHLHDTYILSHQDMEYLREPLGMMNKHLGYVYLIDDQCRIRWAAVDLASPTGRDGKGAGEVANLLSCIRALLARTR